MKPSPPAADLPAEANSRRSKAFAVLAMLLIAGTLAGQVFYFIVDRSDHINGYEHQMLHGLLVAMGNTLMEGFAPARHLNPYADNMLYLITGGLVKLVGYREWVLLMAPMLGWALILWFGFRLAARLGGGKFAGWLAATALALTPFVYGLTRRFDAWPLTIGIFLGVAYYLTVYLEQPSLRGAAIVGAFAAAGAFTPGEGTPLILYIFYLSLPLGWAALRTLLDREQAPRDRVLRAGVMLAVAFIPMLFWLHHVHLLNGYYLGYLSAQGGSPDRAGWPWRYLVISSWETLGWIGAIFFFSLALVFPLVHRGGPGRFWFAYVVVTYCVMSFIPKKNPWYILEILALLPILAAVAVSALVRKLGRWAGGALVGVFLAGLVFQYAFFLFLPWLTWRGIRDQVQSRTFSVNPAACVIDLSPQSYRSRIAIFRERFLNQFPRGKTVHLGLLAGGPGYEMATSYLRFSDHPPLLYDVLTRPLSEVCRLDAVVVIAGRAEMGLSFHQADAAARYVQQYQQSLRRIFLLSPEKEAEMQRNARELIGLLHQARKLRLADGLDVYFPAEACAQAPGA